MTAFYLFLFALNLDFQIQFEKPTETVEAGEQRGTVNIHGSQSLKKVDPKIASQQQLSNNRLPDSQRVKHHRRQDSVKRGLMVQLAEQNSLLCDQSLVGTKWIDSHDDGFVRFAKQAVDVFSILLHPRLRFCA
jgi:hypothetical protein